MYRTVIVVEILGNEPFSGDLADLSEAITTGDYSGTTLAEQTTEVGPDEMASLLTLQGSDPSFLLGDPE